MAKAKKDSGWGNFRPGRHSAHEFHATVSPLGEDCAQTPTYSPCETVEGAEGQGKGYSSKSESARDQRRGG